MAFTIIFLGTLTIAALLTRRFTPEDREHRGLSFPPEWPRLPELPPSAYETRVTGFEPSRADHDLAS